MQKMHMVDTGADFMLEFFSKKESILMRIPIKSMILCALFAGLTAVGAFIKIPMPMMDYITLQFLFVIMSAMLIGSKRASLSMLVYILMGLVGFPVFAQGGGIAYVLKPSFGYIISFVLCAFVVGRLCEKRAVGF